MIEKLRIRLADWRDRDVVQPLRRMLGRPVDGGLYEMLNWPTYHTHVALLDGKTIGFTSVTLDLQAVADECGTVVMPEFRRQGVATELRATQVRDLALMGYGMLYLAAKEDDEAAVGMAHAHFGPPLTRIMAASMPPHLYFGANLGEIAGHLLAKNVRKPYPLSALNHEKLMNKAIKAITDLSQLQALGDFNMRKAMIRQGPHG